MDNSNDISKCVTLLFTTLDVTPDDPLRTVNDIVLSSCEVVFSPIPCQNGHCGRHVVQAKAISDFIRDGDRSSRIITAQVEGKVPVWQLHDPPDVFVSIAMFKGIAQTPRRLRLKCFDARSNWDLDLIFANGEEDRIVTRENLSEHRREPTSNFTYV